MRLHHNPKLFSDTIRATSQYFNIIPLFIEKDYWITHVLKRLAQSKYSEQVVFKGGTSLSKAYRMINRFSEDIDFAVISDKTNSGNKIKALIRNIEKEITEELSPIYIDSISSKGSRFRKSIFEYQSINRSNISNKIIIETNSFANPYPYSTLDISNFICDFLVRTNNHKYIQEYELDSFTIKVLDKRQTLIEKLVSLIRFSFDTEIIISISSKIRHFYDLFYLMSDQECISFINSQDFLNQFDTILNHDRETFDIPNQWQNKPIFTSPLITDFDNIWHKLKQIYTNELTALAFSPIPSEKEIADNFKIVINILNKFEA